MTLVSVSKAPEWYSEVPRSIGRQTLFGLLLMGVTFGGFGVWAGTAPLASAVIAPGTFVATGANKIVQHLEGGIIRELLVTEGDRVVQGQNLVHLDPTTALSNARGLHLRLLRLEAMRARLQGQVDGADAYVPPASVLEEIDDPEVRSIIDGQRESFDTARLAIQNRVDVLTENVRALEFQHTGITSQLAAFQRQVTLLEQDRDVQNELFARQLTTLSSVNSLQRALADADGDIARMEAEAEMTLAQIEQHRREITQLVSAERQTALAELQDVSAELETLREEMNSVQNVLSRTVITSPSDGIVVRMHYHTSGGVIESGSAIMEILPSDVPLIIEAQIPRMQIDELELGQTADIRLSALNQRTTPILEGKVDYISADAIEDGNAANEIYVARVTIAPEQLERVTGFTPTPGMPVEILIETDERTFFEYLSKPIADSMTRAFREN
ncbi:HlyD family type I secretion periplasmic adaptor subunit [Pelagibacterium flavum]|uniref:Membrane fusion protein (MFP) family protein n=1 Tax=Pelagibacterium flavum TaxID=2984530 RepID=A0ABY6IKT1_9HYPH|nr:HlyD family type I secretion periplasmic adaptor subunit [Pelagibacterium sp. YIM 151497]UYQ71193.1 HlyD family type I secretion periplasmic adaptor subunit [Pelagibacterium sp. YIM 151497]|tara:strand:+ start:5821 stop:7152 length:1332 start_codon:yes stop_codon:yes gene_type:complete